MTGKTHLAAGISTGLATSLAMGTNDYKVVAISVFCSSIGSLMPDIDCEDAMISRLGLGSRILSKICSTLSSHRRFWHTPIAGTIFALTTSMLIYSIGLIPVPAISKGIDQIPFYIPFIMFYLGWLSHLLLDSFNPQGVPWLWPMQPLSKKKKFKRLCITTASEQEKIYKVLCLLTMFVLTTIWIIKIYKNTLYIMIT